MIFKYGAILFALLGIVFYCVYDSRTSIGVNIFHWGQQTLDALTRSPIHSIAENDAAGLARLRYMYSLMGSFEPRAKSFSTVINVRSSLGGHDIPVAIYKNARCQLSFCPLVLFFHGGGFVIGDVPSYEHITTTIADRADVVVAAIEYRLGEYNPIQAFEDFRSFTANSFVHMKLRSINFPPAMTTV
jgi:acetyl esterase